MLAKCGDVVLDASSYSKFVRITGREFDGITDRVSPEPGVTVDDEGIGYSGLYLIEGQSCWLLTKILGGGYKLEKYARIGVQKEGRVVGIALEGDKSFGGGIQFQCVNLFADQAFNFGAIRFIIDSTVDEQIEVREYLRYAGLPAFFEQFLEVHLYPGRNAGYHAHIFEQRFIYYFGYFWLPIFDAVGVECGHLIGFKPGRNQQIGDSG